MSEQLRLMCILAHPDDESLGTGGTLAKYAAEGMETYLVTATRGERGWPGDPAENPGLEGLGKIREKELLGATKILGVRDVHFLDYIDGDLDQANVAEAAAKIATYIRRIRPQVAVTFGSDGAYGHPDHIAISQLTTAAIIRAADASFEDGCEPHTVSKLYHMILTQQEADLYMAAFGEIIMPVDGIDRTPVVWPDWAVSAKLDTADYWPTVWQAVSCHRSQLSDYGKLAELSDADQRQLWAYETYYRVFSLVNGGRGVETDLFEGLR
jgi:LmbE family N-acetylglucosaminyl deacetylase